MHHRLQHFFGRHHGGRGFGRFGKGFMDAGDKGGRAFGMGRKLASVDLQLLILGLLAEKPRHGYEIIKTLDERSKGFYIPSPGMVYPALTYLEEIGHATVEVDGARKLYHITDAGRAYLDERRPAADAAVEVASAFGSVATSMLAVGSEAGDLPPLASFTPTFAELACATALPLAWASAAGALPWSLPCAASAVFWFWIALTAASPFEGWSVASSGDFCDC